MGPSLLRRHPRPRYRRERVDLPDGDFIDLDWHGPPPDDALVVILHGLEGSSSSHYIRGLAGGLADAGVASVVMHQRGCSGEPNRLARFYHAGEIDDFGFVLERLHRRLPATRLYAAGYSLGASILLKWLGRRGADSLLHGAAAASVPFLLAEGAQRLERGISRLYQAHLIASMKRSVTRKRQLMPYPVDPRDLARCRTFEQIDTCLTAVLHGFEDAQDYYTRSSCRQFLGSIRTPTLIVHARDDPFMTRAAIPNAEELSSSIRLELSESGGHCGFVAGAVPFRPRYWLDRRIVEFVDDRRSGPGCL